MANSQLSRMMTAVQAKSSGVSKKFLAWYNNVILIEIYMHVDLIFVITDTNIEHFVCL